MWVGTWCRFGVDDSVGLAIFLENRYKGLRSPHKTKMAVSGCTGECAEAQSKDVGVIATEKGWNLYVCGNGGMKPRHAELLASDLDTSTLIKYIDRFFMFYIQTADRLQRTSVWRDNMEGGLDYLKDVIVHDSLGIAAELERRTQHVTGNCIRTNGAPRLKILKYVNALRLLSMPKQLSRMTRIFSLRLYVARFVQRQKLNVILTVFQWLSLNTTVREIENHNFKRHERTELVRSLCNLDDITPNTGVAAPSKISRLHFFAWGSGTAGVCTSNQDPFSLANVMARGILGDLQGERVVSFPNL